jgi:hypothetical protein
VGEVHDGYILLSDQVQGYVYLLRFRSFIISAKLNSVCESVQVCLVTGI